MRIAATIPAWRDGIALHEAVESVAPFVDDVLVLDGGIAGVVPADEAHTDELELDAVAAVAANVQVLATPAWSAGWTGPALWASQGEKRRHLCRQARSRSADWCLMLDSDERLHNGDRLRPLLEGWPHVAFPVPFEHEDGLVMRSPYKCFRLDALELVAQSAFFENGDGQMLQLASVAVAAEPALAVLLQRALPWISHHPERRPAGRRDVRLGAHEERLEPSPAAAVWRAPAATLPNALEPVEVS